MEYHKYANWYEEPKTKENLYAVLSGYKYVEYHGNIYEFIARDEESGNKILLSDVNNGEPLYTSWYEILYSPAFSIMRKEA